MPKPGTATLLICGQGLFGQLLGRGINPAWWPYYLWCALAVEILLLAVGSHLRTLPAMLAAGVIRGLLAYSYMYLILAPFLWQQFYAPWYVGLKIVMGMIGCGIGAVLAWRLAPRLRKPLGIQAYELPTSGVGDPATRHTGAWSSQAVNLLPPKELPMSDSLHGSLGAEYRRQLLLLNRERIEFAYVKAQANGLDDPIILVLDLQDDGAARLAQLNGLAWEQIERWREECGHCDVVPTQVLAAPRWAVMCVVGPMTPNGKGNRQALPAGGVPRGGRRIQRELFCRLPFAA